MYYSIIVNFLNCEFMLINIYCLLFVTILVYIFIRAGSPIFGAGIAPPNEYPDK